MTKRRMEIWLARVVVAGVLVGTVMTAGAEDGGDVVEARTRIADDDGDVSGVGGETARLDQRIGALDVKGLDVREVIRLLAQTSGVNITASAEVTGPVTLFMQETTLRQVLHVLLEANDWAYLEEDGVIKIMGKRQFQERTGYAFGRPLATRVYRLHGSQFQDIPPLLRKLQSEAGDVMVDASSRWVIVRDDARSLEAMEILLQSVNQPLETAVFALDYAQAEDVVKQLQEHASLSPVPISFDERSNTVVLRASAERILQARDLVAAVDVPGREVHIEAKIVQVTLTDDFRMGIDWEAVLERVHAVTMKSNFDVLNAGDKRGQLSVGILADDNYRLVIEALQEIGHTNLLSNPSITAVHNHEAKMLVGSTEPYVTSTTTTPSAGPTTTSENVNFIEVGVKLYVTPQIHHDGYITMAIKPEVSSVVRNITTASNNTIPVVETSEAETTVRIKDGVTLIIGGLVKEESIRTEKKVPLLANVPLLGQLFRSQSQQLQKNEIVIFLTPRIIDGDQSIL